MKRHTAYTGNITTPPAICAAILMEIRIIGSNLPCICVAIVAAFAFFARISGDLINLSCVCFEVIFPFFTTIAIGEWGKIRADANYDIIASQGKSLFYWVLTRYLAVWSMCSLSAVCGMAAVFFIRREIAMGELLCIYFPTAFLLSSLAVLTGLVYHQEHMATLVCGLVWLVSLMLRSLLRLPGMACVYLFIRFAGGYDDIWLVNKGIVSLISLGLWSLIYWICKKYPRRSLSDILTRLSFLPKI